MQNSNILNPYSFCNNPSLINTFLPSQNTLIQSDFTNNPSSNNISIQQNQTQQPRTSNQSSHSNIPQVHPKVITQRNLTIEIIEITENIDDISQPTNLFHLTYCNHIRINSLQSSISLPDNITKLTINHMLPGAAISIARNLQKLHIGTLYTGTRVNVAHLPIETHSIEIKEDDALIFGNGKNCQIF